MCPDRDNFIFLTLLIISDFCSLPDPDVGLPMLVYTLVILSILLSILVYAAANLLCACLVSVKCSRGYRSWKRH